MKKFKNFKFIDRIKRFRGIFPTRLNKIRLDANERISEFDKKFFNKLKKKIQSQHFTAYPEIEEIYDLYVSGVQICNSFLKLKLYFFTICFLLLRKSLIFFN